MRAPLRWFLFAVLALDAAAAAAYLTGVVAPVSAAQPAATAAATGAATNAATTPAALPADVPQSPAPAAVPAGTPASAEGDPAAGPVTATAPGSDDAPGERDPDDVPATEDPADDAAPANDRGAAFTRLLRAYENMEPESAAKAIGELAARDREAVVELVMGWKPRTCGAILDALTQTNPALAADLSYTIWKRSGSLRPETATAGR
jgi:hypothetical protein